MTAERSLRGLAHRATHRISGLPAHAERSAGHQGRARHGRARRRLVAPRLSRNHSPARPPRVMVAWQRRIAAFFGREL
ncbi:hypothetical protein GCM10023322_51390 [Rugosimonospora acidiphila]|uniref:Uncharacterized protein n=1 Tax=Rugosimonospora acidiphila TaxID=556531 RepID=A0ABP9S9Z0_9ACTN